MVRNPYARVLERNNRAVLCNSKNGTYLKTSRKYFQVLETILKEDNQLSELRKYEDENEICRNILNLYDKLCGIEFYISDEAMKDIHRDRLEVVFLAVTNRCNLRCKHCCVSAGPEERDRLDTKQLIQAVEQIIELNPRHIGITGGEPLLREDILPLLEYTRKKYQGELSLLTNGLLIHRQNVQRIVESVDSVSISLDGYDEKSCARIRGEGVFQRAVEAIGLLQEKGLQDITVSMLISKGTVDEEEKFRSLCQDMGVKPLVRRFTPTGRGKENCDEVMPDHDYNRDFDPKRLSCGLCNPGKHELYINGDGDIYPCGSLLDQKELIMGNITRDRLKDIYEKYSKMPDTKALDRLRPWSIEGCNQCDLNIFCHECIANIISLKENPVYFQQFCKRQKEILEKKVWGP